MLEGRLVRWSPLSGVIFAVLFVLAAVLFDDEPGPEASDSTILAYYADDGNQLKLEAAFLLATIAGVFFIWFAGTLSERLRASQSESGWLGRIVLVSGGAFAAVMVVASAVYQFVSDALDDNPDRFQVDPQIARLLTNGAYSLNPEGALPLVAPLVLAASLGFLSGRLLPRWIGWAGFVVALGCLIGFLGVTTGLFLLWVIVVAIYLTKRTALGENDGPVRDRLV